MYTCIHQCVWQQEGLQGRKQPAGQPRHLRARQPQLLTNHIHRAHLPFLGRPARARAACRRGLGLTLLCLCTAAPCTLHLHLRRGLPTLRLRLLVCRVPCVSACLSHIPGYV